jgi:hypothetical protein
MREGIEFHIEGLRADGEPVPEPTTRVTEISVPAQAPRSLSVPFGTVDPSPCSPLA